MTSGTPVSQQVSNLVFQNMMFALSMIGSQIFHGLAAVLLMALYCSCDVVPELKILQKYFLFKV